MSPTLFRHKSYRFFFFSREEERMHIHVASPDGEAKFWLEPDVSLAENWELSRKEIKQLQKFIEERKDEIIRDWRIHFQQR